MEFPFPLLAWTHLGALLCPPPLVRILHQAEESEVYHLVSESMTTQVDIVGCDK